MYENKKLPKISLDHYGDRSSGNNSDSRRYSNINEENEDNVSVNVQQVTTVYIHVYDHRCSFGIYISILLGNQLQFFDFRVKLWISK